MPKPSSDEPLSPSLLDRLLDLEPKVSREPAAARSRVLAQIKAAVRRDLEWLLNTRLATEPPADLPQLRKSVLAFGLVDFTHASLTSGADRVRLRRAVEATIRQFEPRLLDVVVTLVDGTPLDRTVRFRIDAMLRVDPAPEPVTFDSLLQPHTRAFVVRGEGA